MFLNEADYLKRKWLSQNCQLVVEPVETTFDYQSNTHFDRLSVQITAEFKDSFFF